MLRQSRLHSDLEHLPAFPNLINPDLKGTNPPKNPSVAQGAGGFGQLQHLRLPQGPRGMGSAGSLCAAHTKGDYGTERTLADFWAPPGRSFRNKTQLHPRETSGGSGRNPSREAARCQSHKAPAGCARFSPQQEGGEKKHQRGKHNSTVGLEQGRS